jgi:glutathione S-transferase
VLNCNHTSTVARRITRSSARAAWCFAALNTVERPLMEIQLIDKFGGGEGAENRRAAMVKEAGRWLGGLERRLDGREWVA